MVEKLGRKESGVLGFVVKVGKERLEIMRDGRKRGR
jgi:hypothetical protein